MKKYLWGALVLVVLLAAASFAVNAQTTARDLSGWAWSSNIGWISFNSTDLGTGTNGAGTSPVSYKVQLEADGDLVGYAWSSNIGWIKFGNLTSIPQDGTNARVLSGTNVRNVVGWVRACGGTVNADCKSATRTDGWDGWINLADEEFHSTGIADGSGGVTYVVTHDTESETDTATLKGYAWGGDVVGWLKFSPTTGVDTVVTPDGGDDNILTLVASSGASSGQSLNVPVGSVVNFNWSIKNLENCVRTESPTGYWSTINPSGSISGDHTSLFTGSGSYTFNTVGTYIFDITCDVPGTSPLESISTSPVTITVSQGAAGTCVLPSHALECVDTMNATFIYQSTEENQIPSGTQSTVTGSCPTSGTNYCVYYCESGYKPNGNRCTRSTVEEI